MLISYKFNNVFSFNQEAEFTMLAPSTKVKKRFPNNFTTLSNGYKLLKDAVIVGENAGGKSNFVQSINYFTSFFSSSDPVRAKKGTINSNNIMSDCPKESASVQNFEIEITNVSGIIYKYFLSLDFCGIENEELYLKDSKDARYQPVFIIRRIDNTFYCEKDDELCKKGICHARGSMEYKVKIPNASDEIKKTLETIIGNDNTIGLFVTKIALLGNEAAVDFINIIKNDLCPEGNPINYDLYLSIVKDRNYLDILKTQEYFEIFRMVDYSIYKIDVDEEKPYTESIIYRKRGDGSTFKRKLRADSSGVREFFAWAIQVYRVVYENKVVIADEMDRVLNPILSDRVIAFVNGKKHFGQFIFTSHNILHLDLKNYMKEQIYFITKDIENLESELYSLADFPEVRYETTKVYEFYMKGILGGTAIE